MISGKRGTIFRGFIFLCSDCDVTYWKEKKKIGLMMEEFIMQISVQKVPKSVYSDWLLNKHYIKDFVQFLMLMVYI